MIWAKMIRIYRPAFARKARIEIVPLIDIIFFLLATFVMVSLSMVKNQGMSVRLPAAVAGSAQDVRRSAVITVTARGDVFFNREEVSLETLAAKLVDFKNSCPDPKIFVQGDRDADFGKVVSVLDLARKTGILKTAIRTSRPEMRIGVK